MAILSPGLFPSDQGANYYPPAPSKAMFPVFSTDPNSKITPQLLLALGSGLLSGNTWADQIANAGLGANQAVTAQVEKQKTDAQKNQTVAALQAYPDLANAVSIGAKTPGEALSEMWRRKQQEAEDAKPKYTVIDGKIVQTNAPGGQIKVAADFSDPNAKLPESVKTSKYWADHPDEYQASLKQQQEANTIKNAPSSSDQMKGELETMKTYRGEDPVKQYQVIHAAYLNGRKAADLGNQGNPAGDMALIYSFMKMQDPQSVVREGEYATAQNSGNVEDWIVNLYNRAREGTRLNPEMRQRFTQMMDQQYQTATQNLDTLNKQYQPFAQQYNIPTDRFMVQPEKFGPLKIGGDPVPVDLGNGVNGTIQKIK